MSNIEKSWAARRAKYGPSGRKPQGGNSKPPRIPGVTREAAPRASSPDIVPRHVYEAVGFGVAVTNGLLLNLGVPMVFGPEAWTQEDKLTGTEIGMLTQALGDEALTNKELARWLTKIGRSNAHAKLGYVLFLIAAPRLARRGMLPPEVMSAINDANAQAVTAAAGADVSAGNPDVDPFDFGAGEDSPPVPVEAGGAPDDDGGHGEREVEPGSVPFVVPDVVHDVPNEVGRRVLRRPAGQNGVGAPESPVSPVGAHSE
jgi:hypothetical protein